MMGFNSLEGKEFLSLPSYPDQLYGAVLTRRIILAFIFRVGNLYSQYFCQ
jgi:hypothetical protein